MSEDLAVFIEESDVIVTVSADVDLRVYASPDVSVAVPSVEDVRVYSDAGLPGPRGARGLQGDPPNVSRYLSAIAPLAADGTLTIDCAVGSTQTVLLDRDVSSVLIVNRPAVGYVERIELIVIQDNQGGRVFHASAWPVGTDAPGGTYPSFSLDPGLEDHLLLSVRAGSLSLALVGSDYRPIA